MNTATATARERVQRGIDFLNRHAPGWWDRIDLNHLDLASSSRCICAQVFAAAAVRTWDDNGFHYAQMLAARESESGLLDGGAWSKAHGFFGLRSDEDEWRRQLTEIRVTRNEPVPAVDEEVREVVSA